jgi:hypothetical protein
MEYQSPFEDWYTYGTVHKPLPDFTCETGLVLFPPELVPGVGHSLVDNWEITLRAVSACANWRATTRLPRSSNTKR